MTGQTEVLRVLLSNEELDDSELEVEALRLRDELLELDVVDVHHATSGPPPAGARGMDVGAIGQLLIDLSRTPELVSAVVGVVTGWLARSGNRKAQLDWGGKTIQVEGISSKAQQQLIDAWIHDVKSSPGRLNDK